MATCRAVSAAARASCSTVATRASALPAAGRYHLREVAAIIGQKLAAQAREHAAGDVAVGYK
jgi:hypothetical protein